MSNVSVMVEGSNAIDMKESVPYEEISLEDAFDFKVDRFMQQLVDGEIDGIYSLVIKEVEKRLIDTVLTKTNGNQLKASKILGINRNTLRKKMSMFNISQEKIKELVKRKK